MADKKSGDTAHLYDSKTVRSSAPSRKKLAGNAGIGTEIPKDAVPEIQIPSFVESLLGGPLVPKMKFLPPDKMVQNLQLAVYGILIALAFLTLIVSPGAGTVWYMLTGSIGVATTVQVIVIALATIAGFYGTFRRDGRYLLMSFLFLAWQISAIPDRNG